MVELFPSGFEEVESPGAVELAAYTDAGGEERLWQAFGGVSSADVEEGWGDRWRDFHRPVSVGGLWVGPPWEEPPPGSTAIVIDPGRAFGTGAHATTRLCLELLLDEPRGSVLDVGCGSGVLAIAAAKLGFGPVVAIDSDAQAVEAARQNAAANRVLVDVRLVDVVRAAECLPRADLALLNISLETVLAVAPCFDAARVITSGYLLSEEPRLAGYARARRCSAEGWAADLHVRG